ncbi:unnamed protein product [Heligmosomoides polygyrus]|uniref:HTH asnC-type domain-containing protein n=1 Tax=Heligmosomoides polygyrus TaxID=6339 RepID=A0A183G4R1_HELPZ|nr:unnamed protein product [Heligmosomoides polygyrus]
MFARFRKGEVNLQGSFRLGRDVDNDRLRQLVESDPRRTTRGLAQELGVHYVTIARHLHQLGKVHKLAQWAPMASPNATVLRWPLNLLSCRRTDSWLKSIIKGGEKWACTSTSR